MDEGPSARGAHSPLAISSATLLVVAPLAAWILLQAEFPGREAQDAANSGNARWAVAILGIHALFRAAGLLWALSLVGALLGGASLLRRERRRKLGVIATWVHALAVVFVAAGIALAVRNAAR